MARKFEYPLTDHTQDTVYTAKTAVWPVLRTRKILRLSTPLSPRFAARERMTRIAGRASAQHETAQPGYSDRGAEHGDRKSRSHAATGSASIRWTRHGRGARVARTRRDREAPAARGPAPRLAGSRCARTSRAAPAQPSLRRLGALAGIPALRRRRSAGRPRRLS